MVFVLSASNKKLMPTTEYRAGQLYSLEPPNRGFFCTIRVLFIYRQKT